MPQRNLKGRNQKIVYRNERYTKGTVTTNDPLYEGSFRRLINFKVSNQNSSLENRDPFLTVPLYDLNNEYIELSKYAHLFYLKEDTEHAFIFDLHQKIKEIEYKENKVFYEIEFKGWNKKFYKKDDPDNELMFRVVDGDTINIEGKRYRLAIIDTPELEDTNFEPQYSGNKTRGEEAKQYLESRLKSLSGFRISQFDFQSDKVDQFGRPIVFIISNENEIINIELLEKGYALFYGLEKFSINKDDDTKTFNVPNKIKFKDDSTYYFHSKLRNAYLLAIRLKYSPLNRRYFHYNIVFDGFQPNYAKAYTKLLVHKIEKNSPIEKTQILDNDLNFIKEKFVKRVIKTFEVNELETKIDLERFTEEQLKYELVVDQYDRGDFSLTNSKYEDQFINFLVRVYDSFDNHIYTGPAQLTRTSPDLDNGIFETFNIKTYKRPEVHIELQDQTNFKPNMLSDLSIIPVPLDGLAANVRGVTSPKVDAVLLRTTLNANLRKSEDPNEPVFRKYFQTNSLIYNRFKENSEIEAIFKTPYIKSNKNEKGKKYMYRWDLISAKEIDVGNKDEIENFKPYFRTAWTDLDDQDINISQNKDRLKRNSLTKESAINATKYFIIERAEDAIENDDQLISLPPFEEIKHGSSEVTLGELRDEIKDFLEFDLDKLESIFKGLYSTGGQIPDDLNAYIRVNLRLYQIKTIEKQMSLKEKLSQTNEEGDFEITLDSLSESKHAKWKEIRKVFKEEEEQEGSVSFVFLPYKMKVKDEDDKLKIMHMSSTIQSITFNLSKERSISLPPLIDVNKHIFGNQEVVEAIERERRVSSEETGSSHAPYKTRIDEFFQDGFTAVFYLYAYDDVEDLKYDDIFYDNVAYKRTSATYLFKDAGTSEFRNEDFIRDKLQREANAIRYSQYIGKFDDMTVMYGNPRYRNTIFMSEPGSPYYYGLVNAFEFDNEVVHVNQFKDVLLVFTINDIFVLFWHEEKVPMQDQEGNHYEQSKWTIRQRKVLYNISTEHKNKNSIKNLTRYITMLSNNVLYIITPSSYIQDETQFSLKVLSQNIEHLMQDPLYYINERLEYFGITEKAIEYEFNLLASDNIIKLYYSTEVGGHPYTLVVNYDVINNRWYEEDTITFGNPKQIYLLDATTGYEMLTKQNNQMFITVQTDKYKNIIMDEFSQSFYDVSPNDLYKHPIKYFIDTGYLKLSEHLRKRFRQLLLNIKNIDSKKITFTYDFTIDDVQYISDFILEYNINNLNEVIEVEKINIQEMLSEKQDIKEVLKAMGVSSEQDIKEIIRSGHLENFILDFSNLSSSDIMMVRHNLLGRGRLPRVKMGFNATNRFYLLSFGIVYSEKGGR